MPHIYISERINTFFNTQEKFSNLIAALAFALLSQTFKNSFFMNPEVWEPHSG